MALFATMKTGAWWWLDAPFGVWLPIHWKLGLNDDSSKYLIFELVIKFNFIVTIIEDLEDQIKQVLLWGLRTLF